MTKAAAQRRNPAQERSKITVKAIVEAAARVFAARGCAPATTNAIAAKAGVSVGSLYQYFHDKMALLRAVRAHSHETLMATLATACRAPAPTLETALRAVIAAAAAHHR
jgi:AcrR family transcriptional regulator